jgi:hypothetical protein
MLPGGGHEDDVCLLVLELAPDQSAADQSGG